MDVTKRPGGSHSTGRRVKPGGTSSDVRSACSRGFPPIMSLVMTSHAPISAKKDRCVGLFRRFPYLENSAGFPRQTSDTITNNKTKWSRWCKKFWWTFGGLVVAVMVVSLSFVAGTYFKGLMGLASPTLPGPPGEHGSTGPAMSGPPGPPGQVKITLPSRTASFRNDYGVYPQQCLVKVMVGPRGLSGPCSCAAPTAPLQVTTPAAPTAPPQVTTPAAPTAPPQVTTPAAPTAPPQVTTPAAPTAPPQVTTPAAPTAPQVTTPAAPAAPPQVTTPAAPTAPPQVTTPAAPTAPPQVTTPAAPAAPPAEPDCAAYKAAGHMASGVYTLGSTPALAGVEVYCDMKPGGGEVKSCGLEVGGQLVRPGAPPSPSRAGPGGGWTVIQRRLDGSVFFNRTWEEYKHGFGNKNGEYWLGNENIHRLTTQKDYILRIDMMDWDGNKRYAEYNTFRVSGESEQYRLTISGYSGTAGDTITDSYSIKRGGSWQTSGQMFSTVDRDNDGHIFRSCSQRYGQGGGWYRNGCGGAKLNGRYLGNCGNSCPHAQGVTWYDWRGHSYSLNPKRSGALEMVIKHNNGDDAKRKPLLDLCKTRCAERHKPLEMIAYSRPLDKYGETFADWDTGNRSAAHQILKSITSFDFIVVFLIMYHYLSHLAGITVKLQGRAVDEIQDIYRREREGVEKDAEEKAEENFRRDMSILANFEKFFDCPLRGEVARLMYDEYVKYMKADSQLHTCEVSSFLGVGCGEVKCPYCLKDIDFHQYVQRRTSCLHLDKFRLKKDHQYYYQVQQQLFSTGSAVPAHAGAQRRRRRSRYRRRVEDVAPYRTDNGRGWEWKRMRQGRAGSNLTAVPEVRDRSKKRRDVVSEGRLRFKLKEVRAKMGEEGGKKVSFREGIFTALSFWLEARENADAARGLWRTGSSRLSLEAEERVLRGQPEHHGRAHLLHHPDRYFLPRVQCARPRHQVPRGTGHERPPPPMMLGHAAKVVLECESNHKVTWDSSPHFFKRFLVN
ncbi:Fibrinogen- domains (FReDs) [Branchiostoma belcheri]|nr:Fibrinogen- domains (FReDs) [Branchiostoma belcheri]